MQEDWSISTVTLADRETQTSLPSSRNKQKKWPPMPQPAEAKRIVGPSGAQPVRLSTTDYSPHECIIYEGDNSSTKATKPCP
jgi:hypothetical protein